MIEMSLFFLLDGISVEMKSFIVEEKEVCGNLPPASK